MVIKVADLQPWEEPLYLATGRLVVVYNDAERHIRDLLTSLASEHRPDNRRGRILTAELGAMGLDQALRAIAGDLLPQPEREAIIHGLMLYERVRFYRNLYVHGITRAAIPDLEHPEVGGLLISHSAKGFLAEHFGRVSLDEIDGMTDHAYALGQFMFGIRMHLEHKARPRPSFAPTPLPASPPPPPKPTKPLLRLRERFPPPDA